MLSWAQGKILWISLILSKTASFLFGLNFSHNAQDGLFESTQLFFANLALVILKQWNLILNPFPNFFLKRGYYNSHFKLPNMVTDSFLME